MGDVSEVLRLLWGSIVMRPYVYMFFICFLAFASYQLGLRRMLTFIVTTYAITFACEYSSTRNGFPFGPYNYVDVTRDRELWLSNVPFWDSLSFVFLSYFSLVMAAALLTDGRKLREGEWSGLSNRATPYLGGIIMMLLDVVIDPVALQGRKWFLGQIYSYPYEGFYFGVTLANFAGWFFVGFATQRVFQWSMRFLPWTRGPWRRLNGLFIWGVYAVYAGVFLFNLSITVMIKDYALAKASLFVTSFTLAFLALALLAKDRDARRAVA
jgi:putative membrane protein